MLLTRLVDGKRMVLSLLLPHERFQLVGLGVLMAVAGVIEVCSVVSIIPFLSVAARPETIQENIILRWWFDYLGFEASRSFLVFGGGVLVVIILLTNGLQALVTYLQLRFSGAVNTSVAVRLFQGYLNQRYEYYVKRNSADLQACVQAEAVYVQSAILQPALQITQKTISICLLLTVVMIANPLVALVGFLCCGGLYAIVFLIVRRRLRTLGAAIGPANKGRFKAVNEAFGTPKLTKLMHLEQFFGADFSENTRILNRSVCQQQMLAQIPRFALESLAFGGILIMAITLIATSSQFNEVVPILGFYAFAGYRLMPAVQVVYSGISRLQFGWSRLVTVHREFQSISTHGESVVQVDATALDSGTTSTSDTLPIVELRNVCFQYETAAEQTLKDLSLVIEQNVTVGVCGTTGAGKTTLLDILLGLLEPQSGQLLVDGLRIGGGNRRQWQKQIGYVPQDIALTDTSIALNVAFGVKAEEVDMERVHHAAQLAGIQDFIEQGLPEKYETKVGERGVRLSGGQRQRIGIARALYGNPRILVFDEATSSLDTETEKTVMNAIRELAHKMTIVMVAHRVNTLEPCDVIYRLEAGSVVQHGTFEELFSCAQKNGVAHA